MHEDCSGTNADLLFPLRELVIVVSLHISSITQSLDTSLWLPLFSRFTYIDHYSRSFPRFIDSNYNCNVSSLNCRSSPKVSMYLVLLFSVEYDLVI